MSNVDSGRERNRERERKELFPAVILGYFKTQIAFTCGARLNWYI
jgi:hypothetical protein